MVSVRKFVTKIYPKLESVLPDMPHIIVLFGGMSAERDVSISSSKAIIKSLVEMNYNVTPVDMGYDIAIKLLEINPDCVYIILHGTYGEDGCIQGLLKIMDIPFTHSDVLASALSLNKLKTLEIVEGYGIKCAKRTVITKNTSFPKDPLPRPYIIKPLEQGSTVGIVAVFAEESYSAHDYHFKYGDQALIEEFISGQEIQVAIVGGKAIGTLEIIPLKKKIYDYETKYVEGMAEHLCPANLTPSNNAKILKISEQIHHILGCSGTTRLEFIYDKIRDEFFFLEINTNPGFTTTSIVPEIAVKNGISFNNLIKLIIDEAIIRNEKEVC